MSAVLDTADEIACRRVRQAMIRLHEQVEWLEQHVDDPDLLEEADAALADVLYEIRYPQRRAVKVVKTPTLPRDDEEDCGCPADLRMAAVANSRRPVTSRTGLADFMCSIELRDHRQQADLMIRIGRSKGKPGEDLMPSDYAGVLIESVTLLCPRCQEIIPEPRTGSLLWTETDFTGPTVRCIPCDISLS